MLLAVLFMVPLCGGMKPANASGQGASSAEVPLEKFVRKLKWFHTEANPAEKIETIEAAMNKARDGLAEGQLYLAYAYINGIGVEMNREKGLDLLRQAAANGSKDAKDALKEFEENGTLPQPPGDDAGPE